MARPEININAYKLNSIITVSTPKVKLSLCREGVWGNRCIDPHGKSPWYLLDKRLGGTQSRFGQYGEVKILDPTGT
jgi:hypothetical protein